MDQPYIGEIRMFAGNFAPAGWELCQGQSLPISENEALFTLIGTTYGGDGQATFNLPNLSSRIPLHFGTGPDGTTYQIGEMAGTEQETLSTQQIPVHTHQMIASAELGNVASPTNAYLARLSSSNIYINDTPGISLNANTISPAGGSQPHENTQPFLCINFIISLFGIYPSQT